MLVMRRFLLSVVVLFPLLVLGPASAGARSGAPPLPGNMAAIGDSISQAADVCCWYGDHPGNSWSTGSAAWDGISSHYERIRAASPAISGHNYNDSVSGAKMGSAPGQAMKAVAQQAGYVTILMGGNDVCTSAPADMTPVETFRSQLRQALTTLDSGLPRESRIFVASIPDVYQLWQIYHASATAQWVWDVANICQSLLSAERTEQQRQAVRQHTMALNAALQQECARLTRCKFDGYALFNYQFTRTDISVLDYFHPSLSGQSKLASITWGRSWWA